MVSLALNKIHFLIWLIIHFLWNAFVKTWLFFIMSCQRIIYHSLAIIPNSWHFLVLKYCSICPFLFPLPLSPWSHHHPSPGLIPYFLNCYSHFYAVLTCFRLTLHSIQSQLFKLPLLYLKAGIKNKIQTVKYTFQGPVWSSQ